MKRYLVAEEWQLSSIFFTQNFRWFVSALWLAIYNYFWTFVTWSFSLIFFVRGCNSTSDLRTNLPASYDMVWPLWQWIPVISFLIYFLNIESKYNENISNYHNLSAALLSVCKDLLSILPVPHTIIHGLNCLQHTWSPIFPNDNSICNFLGTSQLLYLIISCHVAHTAGFLSWNRNPPH